MGTTGCRHPEALIVTPIAALRTLQPRAFGLSRSTASSSLGLELVSKTSVSYFLYQILSLLDTEMEYAWLVLLPLVVRASMVYCTTRLK